MSKTDNTYIRSKGEKEKKKKESQGIVPVLVSEGFHDA